MPARQRSSDVSLFGRRLASPCSRAWRNSASIISTLTPKRLAMAGRDSWLCKTAIRMARRRSGSLASASASAAACRLFSGAESRASGSVRSRFSISAVLSLRADPLLRGAFLFFRCFGGRTIVSNLHLTRTRAPHAIDARRDADPNWGRLRQVVCETALVRKLGGKREFGGWPTTPVPAYIREQERWRQ